jgi:hypothetical protein
VLDAAVSLGADNEAAVTRLAEPMPNVPRERERRRCIATVVCDVCE